MWSTRTSEKSSERLQWMVMRYLFSLPALVQARKPIPNKP
jgi:hypothetical protein